MPFGPRAFFVMVWVAGVGILGCGKDEAPTKPDDHIGPQIDTIPPAAVLDLGLR